MAKLEGVKVLDMVNGQITKVGYNGAVYEHIEGTPKKGDIAEIISEWGHQIKGAFYSVIQEDHFLYSIVEDAIVYIDGELKHASSNVENVRLYRKIGESSLPTIEEVNAKVDSLAERVDALEGDKGEAATFREGDRVRALVNGEFGDITAGEIGEITDMRAAGADEDDPYFIIVETEDDFDYFRPQDLELVTASELKIGDYVVPTSKHRYRITTAPDMKLGKVVSGYTSVQDDIRVEIVAHVDTENIGDSFSVNSKYFRKATDEEIAKYDPKDEEAKFAKIGREPGEFKKGDIARLLKDSGADEKGAFVEIAGDGAYMFIGADGNKYCSRARWFELIAPVEARVDQQ